MKTIIKNMMNSESVLTYLLYDFDGSDDAHDEIVNELMGFCDNEAGLLGALEELKAEDCGLEDVLILVLMREIELLHGEMMAKWEGKTDKKRADSGGSESINGGHK